MTDEQAGAAPDTGPVLEANGDAPTGAPSQAGPAWVVAPAEAAAETAPRCPWCSAVLQADDLAVCPSCGATLSAPTASDAPDEVPGLSAVRAELLARQRRLERPKRRGLRALFGGGDTSAPIEPPSQAELEAIAPPDEAVRREMIRLELEAALAAARGEVTPPEADAEDPSGTPGASGGATDGDVSGS